MSHCLYVMYRGLPVCRSFPLASNSLTLWLPAIEPVRRACPVGIYINLLAVLFSSIAIKTTRNKSPPPTVFDFPVFPEPSCPRFILELWLTPLLLFCLLVEGPPTTPRFSLVGYIYPPALPHFLLLLSNINTNIFQPLPLLPELMGSLPPFPADDSQLHLVRSFPYFRMQLLPPGWLKWITFPP